LNVQCKSHEQKFPTASIVVVSNARTMSRNFQLRRCGEQCKNQNGSAKDIRLEITKKNGRGGGERCKKNCT